MMRAGRKDGNSAMSFVWWSAMVTFKPLFYRAVVSVVGASCGALTV